MMHANSRNGRGPRADNPAVAPQEKSAGLSAAFRSALGAAADKPHLELPEAGGKRAAGMSKAERNDRAAKTVAQKPTVPRSGHR